MPLVFVYGTLKKGQPNYFRLIDSSNGHAEFITCARTVEPYPLVITGECNIPFLLNVPGSGQRVYGEIYSVDQKMLEFLDWFEECPDWYQRTLIQLEILKGNGKTEVEEAFVYTKTKYEPDWLNKPTYDSYDSNGDHGLKYAYEEDMTRSTLDQKSADFSQNSEQEIKKNNSLQILTSTGDDHDVNFRGPLQ